ncbi:MAG TPA: hypothetical protein VND62_06325 [Acidimicrobiales bacterium]|nr:hypothetical protein [Acidimicrobiales bacterium]
MHVLTIDTEHERGSVGIVEVSDSDPDVQRIVLALGNVGDPHDEHAQRRARDMGADAGWLIAGPWELTTDAYAAPVVPATAAPAAVDPLGLERCALCANAFSYDADETATYRWRRTGRHGFVCRWCADDVPAVPDDPESWS